MYQKVLSVLTYTMYLWLFVSPGAVRAETTVLVPALNTTAFNVPVVSISKPTPSVIGIADVGVPGVLPTPQNLEALFPNGFSRLIANETPNHDGTVGAKDG